MFTPFFVARTDVAVEVGRALFKLGEVFDSLQRSLRTKQSLNVDSTQRRGFNATAILLRTNIADEVESC